MIHFYNKQSVTDIIFKDSVVDLIYNLHDRWLDECQYENINDYADVINNKLDKLGLHTNNLVMTTNPFGFKATIAYEFQCGEKRMATLHVCIKADGQYSWSVQSE